MEGTLGLRRIAEVDHSDWAALSRKRIFFAHQSVGADIMQGVHEIVGANPRLQLRIIDASPTMADLNPGLFHARVGRNRDAQSKTNDFERMVLSVGVDIAIMKFCYVDLDYDSDPAELFRLYRTSIEAIRSRAPKVVLVHTTMPLTSDDRFSTRLRNALHGRSHNRDRNVLRNSYNDLLREAYSSQEPFFDIAGIESTHADGTRSSFTRSRRRVFTLAPQLTRDGGHLNSAGRHLAAVELLTLLARVAADARANGQHL